MVDICVWLWNVMCQSVGACFTQANTSNSAGLMFCLQRINMWPASAKYHIS